MIQFIPYFSFLFYSNHIMVNENSFSTISFIFFNLCFAFFVMIAHFLFLSFPNSLFVNLN